MAYQSIDPMTGEEVFPAPTATDAEVEQALATAHEAFRSWSALSFAERAEPIRRAAALFRERAEELGALQTAEMGMPIGFSVMKSGEMIADMLEYYADNAESFLADEPIAAAPEGGTDYLSHEPMGIIYAIEPWNVPYYQPVRPACGNLMAGNVVILKHVSNVPGCANAVAEIFRDAGLPEGVFTNLYASHAQSDAIIADSRVRGVTLTGSDAAGARIAEKAGVAIKRAVRSAPRRRR